MVAISVYKGNLHKVPDVPRKWLMPTRQISVKDFKTLLQRRSQALSRLPSAATATATASEIPNPNPNSNPNAADHNDNNSGGQLAEAEAEAEDVVEGGGVGDEMGSDGGEHFLGRMETDEIVVASDSAAAAAAVVEEVAGHNVVAMEENELDAAVEQQHFKEKNEEEKEKEPLNPATQTINREDEESDKDKRKREVEEKLKILKEKKHSLVLVLKQIQNAEEELKRRSSPQGIAVRSSVPLQVDIPNDTGSMTRLNTPRMGLDGTLGGEMEGGEQDGTSNHNADARHLLRMSSTSPSPSSDSQQKKSAYNVVPHSARTSLGVSSPSRFAPTGPQGQTSNLPTVSVSGTNYVASSPSPAASGGTSVFRENRIPSPWN